MATRPTSLPDWATGGGAEITVPPAPSRASGWLGGIKPPNAWVNWFYNLVYQWLLYVSETMTLYDDLDDALDDLSAGDLFWLFEDDNAAGPGIVEVEKNTGLTAASWVESGIDTCGDLVVFGVGDNELRGVNRALDEAEGGGSPIVYTRSNNPADPQTIRWVKTNGTIVVAGYGSNNNHYVEAWNASTGVSLWDFDVDNDNPVDGCLIGNRVIFIHDLTTGAGDTVANRNVHCLNATTGSVLWSYRHQVAGGVTPLAVCSNGRQVFIAFSASAWPSGANLRALRITDGAGADDEGGPRTATPVDDSGLAWDVAMGDPVNQKAMQCDRRRLYVGKNAAAGFQVQARSAGDAQTVWSVAHTDGTVECQNLDCDQDYVVCAMSDAGAPAEGYVECYDKASGAMVWRGGPNDKTADHTPATSLCTDGSKIYMITEDEPWVMQLSRGNEPHLFQIVDPATNKDGIRTLKAQPKH